VKLASTYCTYSKTYAMLIQALSRKPILTEINDCGMQRRELARYHDIAASTKTRGQGIGFAGVGIKLGLLFAAKFLPRPAEGKATSQPSGTWLRGIARLRSGFHPPVWSLNAAPQFA
jgi:hypothetical protein